MGESEVNNCSHLQAVASCYIRGWHRMQDMSQPWDASLWAKGKGWDAAGSYACIEAGKQGEKHFSQERVQ